MEMAAGNLSSPAIGGRVWVAGARIATPAPGLLVRVRDVRAPPQPFEGAEAAHFPLGLKLPRRHTASEISD